MRARPGRKLRHRIPVRLRHYWKLVATTGAVLAALIGVFGSSTVHPYISSTERAAAVTITENIEGTRNLLDTSIPHSVRIEFNDANYQKMLTEYFDTGEKDYLPADIVIDGTTIKDVGIRLKGNSTLQGLTWNGRSNQRGRTGGPQNRQNEQNGGNIEPPEGFQPPDGVELPGGPAPGDNVGPMPADPGGGGGFGRQLEGEKPETLPWLIRFDEFVEGRRYQGHSQIAVRPALSQSSAQLAEALSISLVGASGEPSQRFAYSAFTVNGRASAPRLLVEYLDEGYAERLGDGVLYKSLASSQFTYQGGDQTEYTDDFKQINRVGAQDLQPVIDLIKWVEQSSDAEFDKGLADRLDVTSFARYVALQNLLLNFDDMAGPGANYYLRYDEGTKKFTVINWDLNLALNGDATIGAHDTVGMGAGGRQRPQEQGQPQDRPQDQEQQNQGPPAGMRQAPSADGPTRRMGGHPLKERFLKSAAFKPVMRSSTGSCTPSSSPAARPASSSTSSSRAISATATPTSAPRSRRSRRRFGPAPRACVRTRWCVGPRPCVLPAGPHGQAAEVAHVAAPRPVQAPHHAGDPRG
jgi:spore coat protein CotH